jgi:hypothetical protein
MNLKKIILLSFFPFVIFSQNYKKDILEVSKNFTGLKNYSLVMHYQLFLDGDTYKPFQEREMAIKRLNKKMTTQQNNGMETLDNGTYQIVVNNKSKIFSARKKDQEEDHYEEIPEFNTYLASNLDSMLLMYEKINFLGTRGDKVSYELILRPNESVEKVTVTIDKTKKMFHSMIIKYKKAVPVNQLDGKLHLVTLQINYKDFKPNSVSSSGLFDEKRFISVGKDGKIAAVKKYASYKLIIPNEDI